jgi:hypothetical protein
MDYGKSGNPKAGKYRPGKNDAIPESKGNAKRPTKAELLARMKDAAKATRKG